MGRIARIETPFIDSVLALVQQMGRTNGVYPTFPERPAAGTPDTVSVTETQTRAASNSSLMPAL
jgi:2-dehydropantoate 2-reductase